MFSYLAECCIHAQTIVQTHMHACVYIHVYIYIYTHTHTHTHIHECFLHAQCKHKFTQRYQHTCMCLMLVISCYWGSSIHTSKCQGATQACMVRKTSSECMHPMCICAHGGLLSRPISTNMRRQLSYRAHAMHPLQEGLRRRLLQG
jgi:hypothetical protein